LDFETYIFNNEWKLFPFREPDFSSSGQKLAAFYENPLFITIFTKAVQTFMLRRINPVQIPHPPFL